MDHLHPKGTLFEPPKAVEQNSNALDSQPVDDHKSGVPEHHDPKLQAMHDKLMAVRGKVKESTEMDQVMCKSCSYPEEICKCMKAGMTYKSLQKMEETLEKESGKKAKAPKAKPEMKKSEVDELAESVREALKQIRSIKRGD